MYWYIKKPPHCGVVTIPNVLSKEEVGLVIALKDKIPQTVYESTESSFSKGVAVWNLNPYAAGGIGWLYDKITEIVNAINEKYFGFELTHLEDSLLLTKYEGTFGGFYGTHCDTCYSPQIGTVRKLSIVIQLSTSDDYEGAELKLYPNSLEMPVIADKTQGSATAFRSHIIHEVIPATKGTRWSLVIWAMGPPPR